MSFVLYVVNKLLASVYLWQFLVLLLLSLNTTLLSSDLIINLKLMNICQNWTDGRTDSVVRPHPTKLFFMDSTICAATSANKPQQTHWRVFLSAFIYTYIDRCQLLASQGDVEWVASNRKESENERKEREIVHGKVLGIFCFSQAIRSQSRVSQSGPFTFHCYKFCYVASILIYFFLQNINHKHNFVDHLHARFQETQTS